MSRPMSSHLKSIEFTNVKSLFSFLFFFSNENQLENDEDVEWGLVSNQKLIQQTSDDNCTAEQTGQTGVSVRLCASRVVT